PSACLSPAPIASRLLCCLSPSTAASQSKHPVPVVQPFPCAFGHSSRCRSVQSPAPFHLTPSSVPTPSPPARLRHPARAAVRHDTAALAVRLHTQSASEERSQSVPQPPTGA